MVFIKTYKTRLLKCMATFTTLIGVNFAKGIKKGEPDIIRFPSIFLKPLVYLVAIRFSLIRALFPLSSRR
jgi:hypothetical protein